MAKLNSPQEVWDYYCSVGGYDQSEVAEDVKSWITPILNIYEPDEIRYVVKQGKNANASVLFDKEYFDIALKAKKLETEMEDLQHIDRKAESSIKFLTDALIESLKINNGEQLLKWAKDALFDEFGPITKQVKFIKPDGAKVEGVVHKQFESIVELATMGENVLLVGPAGTGKSFLAKQLAEALGAHYYKINSPQQPYEWEGFVDANGKLVDTPFTLFARDTEMSVLDIEEIDNMNPSVGVKINDSLDSKVVHLPNGEILDFSKNHIFIASANTWGTGATADYVGRNQLDAATLNRWEPVIINYDPIIEESMCPDTEMLGFLRDFRKQVEKHSIHHIVSYRNMKAMYNWVTNFPNRELEEVLKTVLIRNLEPNDLSTIAYDLKSNKYAEIVKKLSNN